jgi:hypothetical protein
MAGRFRTSAQALCVTPYLGPSAASKSSVKRCAAYLEFQRINLINPAANVLNRSLATMKATQKDTANIVQPLIELLLMTVRAALRRSPTAIC